MGSWKERLEEERLKHEGREAIKESERITAIQRLSGYLEKFKVRKLLEDVRDELWKGKGGIIKELETMSVDVRYEGKTDTHYSAGLMLYYDCTPVLRSFTWGVDGYAYGPSSDSVAITIIATVARIDTLNARKGSERILVCFGKKTEDIHLQYYFNKIGQSIDLYRPDYEIHAFLQERLLSCGTASLPLLR